MRRFFTLFLLFILVGSHLSQPTPTAAQDSASEIIRLVNEFRVGLGLPPFRVNATLSAAAQQHASYMAANNLYSHTGAGGTSPQQRANNAGYQGYVVENIVGGTGMTPRQGLIWWQNSPVHYATIASDRYVEIGAGMATGGGQNYYAIVVGRPSDTPNSTRPTTNNDQPPPVRIIPMTLSQPAEDGSIRHTLQAGQSLWMISAHYDVSLADLLTINNLREDSVVQLGDVIMVRPPDGYVPPPTPTPSPIYVVQRGDTAWEIAAINGLTLEQFLWYNGLGMEAILTPGQEVLVRIPEGASPPPTATPQTTHIVRAGDSLWGLAGRYAVAFDELLVWNDLTADSILTIGQVLAIRSPEPTATPTPLPATPTAEPEPTATPTAVAPSLASVSLASPTLVPPTPTPIPPSPAVTATMPEEAISWGNWVGLGVVLLVVFGAAVFLRR
ncbi:MAG: LysM peptidoglycan-binding domain-containing protein [Chloroflexi bacterium]|nr:LysM peptidoglycan-binding domain-containing protein [Chloroflexota bacterium]